MRRDKAPRASLAGFEIRSGGRGEKERALRAGGSGRGKEKKSGLSCKSRNGKDGEKSDSREPS